MKQHAIKIFPLVKGATPVTNNPLKALLGRGWEAKLCVTGASDFPDVKVAGNVLRSKSTFKLSIRLPPTKNAQDAEKVVTKLLTENVPYGAKVTLDRITTSQGWNAPTYSPYLKNAISEAST